MIRFILTDCYAMLLRDWALLFLFVAVESFGAVHLWWAYKTASRPSGRVVGMMIGAWLGPLICALIDYSSRGLR
jgi:hypothetical protein